MRPFALFVAALAALCVACRPPTAAPQRARPAPLVRVVRVEVRDVPVEARGPVELRPLAQADVTSKVVGYLDAVLVERGDHVRRGQLLALVRPSDLPDQLGVARGTLAQVIASEQLARNDVARARTLAPRGVVSQQELQSAEARLSAAEASHRAAEAQLAVLGTRLSETRITSPLDGVVTQRRLDPGALVGQANGGSVLTVARTDVLRVFIAVGERDARELAVGRDAWVRVDALPGERFTGRVVRVAPAFDPLTRTLDAEVHLDNREGTLRPGMYGRGAVVLAVHPGVITVPVEAVQFTERGRFAFTARDGTAHRVAVDVGVDGGEWLEITRGLAPGDAVIVAGADALSDGAPVRVATPSTPAAPRAH